MNKSTNMLIMPQLVVIAGASSTLNVCILDCISAATQMHACQVIVTVKSTKGTDASVDFS